MDQIIDKENHERGQVIVEFEFWPKKKNKSSAYSLLIPQFKLKYLGIGLIFA